MMRVDHTIFEFSSDATPEERTQICEAISEYPKAKADLVAMRLKYDVLFSESVAIAGRYHDALVAERAKIAALVEALELACRGLDGHGEFCWCEVAVDNPMMRGVHSASCLGIRARLKAAGEGA